MPQQYEAIRDRLVKQGMSEKAAKRRAAKIHNAKNPEHPVGPKRHGRKDGLADL